MTNPHKATSIGNLFAAVGGLFTILSLTVIDDKNWKVMIALLGVVIALYGVILIQRAKKS